MRLEKQNRRGCLIVSIFLAVIAALIAYASFGGVSSESIGDDVRGGMSAAGTVPKPGTPPGAGAPAPASRDPQ
jgi:hypothetical protein